MLQRYAGLVSLSTRAFMFVLALMFASAASAGVSDVSTEDGDQDPAVLSAGPTTIRIGTFGLPLPARVGLARGMFAEEHVDPKFQFVTGSIQQFAFLRDAKYDIVFTASDNCVNYDLNVSNPLGQLVPTKMLFGLDYGWGLRVAAPAGVTTIEQLRGKTLAVDATNSGFAFVLYKILKLHGLLPGTDYTVSAVGGVRQRYLALLDKKTDGTLLSAGFQVRAIDQGLSGLDKVTSIANPYHATVMAATPAYLKANRDAVIRFIRAYYKATAYALDPANRDELIALIAAQNSVPWALATKLYEDEILPNEGIIPNGLFNKTAYMKMLELRAEYNGFDQPQNLRRLASPAGGTYDRRYYRAAIESDERDDASDDHDAD